MEHRQLKDTNIEDFIEWKIFMEKKPLQGDTINRKRAKDFNLELNQNKVWWDMKPPITMERLDSHDIMNSERDNT